VLVAFALAGSSELLNRRAAGCFPSTEEDLLMGGRHPAVNLIITGEDGCSMLVNLGSTEAQTLGQALIEAGESIDPLERIWRERETPKEKNPRG
jgi:hypothetical protein